MKTIFDAEIILLLENLTHKIMELKGGKKIERFRIEFEMNGELYELAFHKITKPPIMDLTVSDN